MKDISNDESEEEKGKVKWKRGKDELEAER